jgi:hypothetical protein
VRVAAIPDVPDPGVAVDAAVAPIRVPSERPDERGGGASPAPGGDMSADTAPAPDSAPAAAAAEPDGGETSTAPGAGD